MPKRPQPLFPEPNTEPFWEGVKQRELRYPVCRECSEVIFTPRTVCTACGSRDLEWKVSRGEGTVYTYSVVRQNRNPAFADLGAYALAYIDLDEGFRMLSNVVGVDNPLTDVSVGQRVKVTFEKQEEGDYLIPLFEPA